MPTEAEKQRAIARILDAGLPRRVAFGRELREVLQRIGPRALLFGVGDCLALSLLIDPEYWKGEAAEAIINAYKENLNSKGFTYTDNKDAADLGIQVSYVQSTYYFTDYGQPEWWWNYPGYWDAPYWGNWGGWYYPYVVNYSITTNSFLTEIMNLKAPEGEKQKLPVLWSSFLSGPASYSGKVNQTLVVRAINQSFAQSPYLTNK